MKTVKSTNRNDVSNIQTRIGDLIGVSAVSTHLYSKATPRRNNQAGELRRKTVQPSPRSWNETLAFAADG
jgi:hypothetical protein